MGSISAYKLIKLTHSFIRSGVFPGQLLCSSYTALYSKYVYYTNTGVEEFEYWSGGYSN